MKSTIHLLLSIVLLLGLCNCGSSKKPAKPNMVARVDMPITHESEPSETLAFNDDTNSFEDMESFVLDEQSDFGPFAFSDLDEDPTMVFNDSNNTSLSWEAVENETQEAFEPIYFGYNNPRISPKEQPKMAKNIEYARELAEEGKTIVCKGKACKLGESAEAYKIAISNQRAQAVAHELIAAGIPKDQIKVFGLGTQESLAMGTSKEDHAPDRCVEMYTTA